MTATFETFTPKDSLISSFVAYYYLDIKPDNTSTEIKCFPHFYTTISLYSSHFRDDLKNAVYVEGSMPLQIFTPVNKEILNVRQIGFVHRVVIVFKPLGVHQFFRDLDFAALVYKTPFFQQDELENIFNTQDTNIIADLLDEALLSRFISFKNIAMEDTIERICNNYHDFSVEQTAQSLEVSRRHLNRSFQKYFGVSVKKFHQIVMFRKAIQSKLLQHPEKSFTEIAHEFYFSDQPHLNKTFQLFTQKTPRTFFSEGTHLGEEDTFWHIKK